jgi:hypothetical protein
VFCTILRWVAWPALFIFIIMAMCTWHKIIKLIQLWLCLGRGGLLWNSNFMGSGCVRTPTSTSPLLRKSFTWSVLDKVMFHCTLWFGDHGSCEYLVLPQDFAIAQAWKLVLRDTTKPAYHSKNPWPHVAWSWPKACLSFKVCCCILISSIAQEHLPWPIFHVALSLSFPWTRHDTSKLLTYSVLP